MNLTEQELESFIESKNLSLDEIQYLKSILMEVSTNGASPTLDAIWAQDYEEIPVSIEQFLTDDRYLGKSVKDDNNELTLYPYWVNTIKELFSPDNQATEVALSGAIGIGKTTIAVVCLCYMLYKLLCLKNPATFYNLNRGSKIAVAFFNINMDQAYGVGYSKMQTYLKQSPWFLEHGSLVGRTYQTYYPGKDIEILVGSKSDHFIGRDVFMALLDELNFAPGQDMSFEKSNVLKLYTTIRRRIDSRFMRRGTIPGKLFLVSSKDDEYDFLEQYISKNKNNPRMYLVDEPLWVVKSGLGLYSGETFNLAVGNRYNKSRILDDNEDIELIERGGQQVIQVPVEHREAFELDINTALADIAGIAIVSSSKFFIMTKVLACYRSYMKNPFKTSEIILGFDDSTQVSDFLIEDLLPKMNRNKPHFIHWDTSKTGDRTGLSMTTRANEKQVKRLVKGQVNTVTDVIHKVVFAVGIKNKPGEEIPFYKIRNFIYYLRNIGFNIVSISCDGYQSSDTIQQFKLQKFNSEILSVDRSRDPYDTARNAVNEGRLIMPKIDLLEEEFADVEDDRLRGKIDHTPNGHKDILDSVVANIYKANRSYAPSVSSTTAENFVAMNSSSVYDDEFDYESWILPQGVEVINPM